jgi:hypothetical protein
MSFDSDKWIEDKKLELVNLLFEREFGIKDFRNTSKVINFDDLQTAAMKDTINSYRKAFGTLFTAQKLRSVLDYYYMNQDKKPVLNFLKQILKYYDHEFKRTSEYQGNIGGKKVYKSKYTIVPSKKPSTSTVTPASPKSSKKKIKTKLVATYKVDGNKP